MPLTWFIHPIPLGAAVCVFDGPSLVALRVTTTPDQTVDDLGPRLRERIVPDRGSASAIDLADQLDAYFDGSLPAFDIGLDWRLTTGFTRLALQAVCEIPYGGTASYGEVAELAGRPRAARAVGTACRTTPFSLVVPVHRVIRSDGSIGEYGGDEEAKRFLLDLERESTAAG